MMHATLVTKNSRLCTCILLSLAVANLLLPDTLGQQQPAKTAKADVATLVSFLKEKASALSASPAFRDGYASLSRKFDLPQDRYDDYVKIRLIFEATRDAGLWNICWAITDGPPNSDTIWRQWKTAQGPVVAKPTAIAECDEISALFCFLARKLGVNGVGLLWPTGNHTVAVWAISPPGKPRIRIVVPTTQIFLEYSDMFATPKFDPWRQKLIYEYSRQDVPDSFELPAPLLAFFMRQVDGYIGATDGTLQQIRYLRSAVLLKQQAPKDAGAQALRYARGLAKPCPGDIAALEYFAKEMGAGQP